MQYTRAPMYVNELCAKLPVIKNCTDTCALCLETNNAFDSYSIGCGYHTAHTRCYRFWLTNYFKESISHNYFKCPRCLTGQVRD